MSDFNGNCSQKINFIEDLRNKAAPYVEKIKKNHIFRTAAEMNNQNVNNNNQQSQQQQQQIQNPSEVKRLNNNNINQNIMQNNINPNLMKNNMMQNRNMNNNNLNGSSFMQSKIIYLFIFRK